MICFLDHPYREDPRVISLLVTADVCHHVIRYYMEHGQPIYIPDAVKNTLSVDYPSSFDDLRARDIRWLISKAKGNKKPSILGSGEMVTDCKWIIDLLRWQWNAPGGLLLSEDSQILLGKITDSIQTTILGLSEKIGATSNLDADPAYTTVMGFVNPSILLGYYFADFFYSHETSVHNITEYKDIPIKVATKFDGGEEDGRPVLVTNKTNPLGKSIDINCKLYNAYFQKLFPFLFFHELTSHLWSSFRDIQFPSNVITWCKNDYEEAFVHWTSLYYIKHFFFEYEDLPDKDLLNQLNKFLITNSIEFSFGDIKEAFATYEAYFQNTYACSKARYKNACITAHGLWVSLLRHLIDRQDVLGISQTWDAMRDIVVDLNVLTIPQGEKDEFVGTLYFLVAPFGEKITWQAPGSNELTTFEVDEKIYETTRKKLRTLIAECKKGDYSLDGFEFFKRLRFMEETGEIYDLLDSFVSKNVY